MADTFFVVQAVIPWSALTSGQRGPLREDDFGSIGVLFVFDTLDKAVEFRDSKAPRAEIRQQEAVAQEQADD